MKKALLVIAATAMVALAGPAMAQKKTLAVVVKGLDNGFFTVMGNGCADWNKANPDSEYECLYTGPALASDEAGEIQIIADLIARDDVAGIAISPSNAPAMAKILTEKAADIAAILTERGFRVEGILALAAIVAGVLWSNALAYRDVWLAPRDKLAELEHVGGGGPESAHAFGVGGRDA